MTFRSPLSGWPSFLAVVLLALFALVLTFTELNAASPR